MPRRPDAQSGGETDAKASAKHGAQFGDAVLRRTIERVPSLDPVKAQSVGAARVVGLVYESLLEYDYAKRPYELRGCLAEGLPEVSDDGQELTFRLRPGVFFGPDECFEDLRNSDRETPQKGEPDGPRQQAYNSKSGGGARVRELVAEDVVYSFKRLADAKVSTGSWWILSGRVAGLDAFHEASADMSRPTDYDAPVEGLRAEGPLVFKMRLTRPLPQLPWLLAMPCCAIVPREAVERYGQEEFGQREVGTGAFRLAAWRRNYRMSFERRPGRDTARDATPDLGDADGAVPVERLEFVVMDDASTRWMAFLAGMLDIEGAIPRDNLDSALAPDGSLAPALAARGIRLVRQPGLSTFYIGINMDDPVLGPNRKLRQALNAAYAFSEWAPLNPGLGVAATGPVPPNVEGRLETPFAYAENLDLAKKLLAEAGYPDGIDPATGHRLTLRIELGQTDQETRETTELMAAFYARIGIVLEASYNNWPAFLRKVRHREAQLFRVGWFADYPDAENFLQLFYGPNASPGPNRCNYANPAFDVLYEEALRERDPARRLDLYRQMQEMIRVDCPWVFLHHRCENALVHERVRNFQMHDFPYGMEKHYRLEK